MKKCKLCGHEIKEVSKTKLIKDLGIEVTIKQEQNNKTFKDIIIPNGFRLIKATEIMRFWDNKDFRDTLLKNNNTNDLWFFVENLDYYKDKYVARFYADAGRAGLDCSRDPAGSSSGLGCIFIKEIKR